MFINWMFYFAYYASNVCVKREFFLILISGHHPSLDRAGAVSRKNLRKNNPVSQRPFNSHISVIVWQSHYWVVA